MCRVHKSRMTNDESMTNDENLGSAGASPAVSRASRDTIGCFSAGAPKRAGEAPALPASSFSRERFLDFPSNDKNLIGIR